MSFNHQRVAPLVERHQAFLDSMAERHGDRIEELKASTGVVVFEGYPVVKELSHLCESMRLSHRDVQFGVGRNARSHWVERIPVVSELWAYFPGDEMATMRIGYADYKIEGSNYKYGVYSRNIRNEKYRDDREQYYMAMADTLERGVKNIKKHLRRYSTETLARMELRDFREQLGTAGWSTTSSYTSARSDVLENDAFIKEFELLVNSGYKFSNLTFDTAVRKMLVTYAAREEAKHQQYHGCYVHVKQFAGEQVFDVLFMHDIQRLRAGDDLSGTTPYAALKADALGTVFEDLPSKLAALSMLDNGAFVDGLGKKISPTSYWVLV